MQFHGPEIGNRPQQKESLSWAKSVALPVLVAMFSSGLSNNVDLPSSPTSPNKASCSMVGFKQPGDVY